MSSFFISYIPVHFRLYFIMTNSRWVLSGKTTITNCRQTHGIVRKSLTTITKHQEDKNKVKQPALSSPSRWLQKKNGHKVTHSKHRTITESHDESNTQQQQNHLLRTDSSQVHWGGGGLNVFYWYQIFAIGRTKCWARMDYCNVSSKRNNIIKFSFWKYRLFYVIYSSAFYHETMIRLLPVDIWFYIACNIC